MKFNFYKYQGTGNDFVILDNRDLSFPKERTDLVAQICDRRFGIGADGFMLLENAAGYDFKMVYYNADGNESSMCGNGGRCLVAFAKKCNVITDKAHFIAVDGPHEAVVMDDLVSLKMIDVNQVEVAPSHVFMNTGSPHHVTLVPAVDQVDVKNQGAAIRYGDLYGQAGANVNFVTQKNENTFDVRTYERGVEDETLSCGTGATAVALAMHKLGKSQNTDITLNVPGGVLAVAFEVADAGYQNIFLKGPATFVFEGVISLKV